MLAQGSSFGTGTNAVSGTRFAYGFARQPQFVYRDDPAHFDLVDAWLSFRTFDGNVGSATITVRGFRGADELFVRAVTLSNVAERVTFDWRGLTEVAFESESLDDARSAVLAMDDVSLATTVPEPATVALVGFGGVALAGVRVLRRRSRT